MSVYQWFWFILQISFFTTNSNFFQWFPSSCCCLAVHFFVKIKKGFWAVLGVKKQDISASAASLYESINIKMLQSLSTQGQASAVLSLACYRTGSCDTWRGGHTITPVLRATQSVKELCVCTVRTLWFPVNTYTKGSTLSCTTDSSHQFCSITKI